MAKTVAFNHELLFERLPWPHRFQAVEAWRSRRALEEWGRWERLEPETIGCVQALLLPIAGESN